MTQWGDRGPLTPSFLHQIALATVLYDYEILSQYHFFSKAFNLYSMCIFPISALFRIFYLIYKYFTEAISIMKTLEITNEWKLSSFLDFCTCCFSPHPWGHHLWFFALLHLPYQAKSCSYSLSETLNLLPSLPVAIGTTPFHSLSCQARCYLFTTCFPESIPFPMKSILVSQASQSPLNIIWSWHFPIYTSQWRYISFDISVHLCFQSLVLLCLHNHVFH